MAKVDRRAVGRRRRRMRRYYFVGGTVAVVAVVITAAWALSPRPAAGPSTAGRHCVSITMPEGPITMVLYNDLVPTTAARFEGLFQGNYYGGLTWHRVESWVIQTGQGASRDPITLEVSPAVKNVRGAVGAARTTDPNSATTQFYILKQDAAYLDGNYSIFGTVLSGMSIADNIAINELITRSALVTCPPV